VVKKQIDPELLVVLEKIPDFDIWKDLANTRVRRQAFAEKQNAHLSTMDHVLFVDHQISEAGDNPDLRVRVYKPAKTDRPLPALLWIHGGGYVLGSIDFEVAAMERFVHEVDCIVIAVEYRLAPEHPYPAPLDDCYQALAWIFASSVELGVDATKVAVGGISAGAGLAAGLAIMARDRGAYPIQYQLLMCPMLDDRNHEPSTHLELNGIAWDRDSNHKGWQAYLDGTYQQERHHYAVPARIDDLSNLPPAYISVGSLDLFRDEDIEYARRLMAAQVGAELHIFPGGTHAFEYIAPSARLSSRAHYLNYEILKHAFGRYQ
jgi:acetyl esterase/lipase